MHILVTGHLGYIGPIMIRTCKEAGHLVTGLDTGYFRDCIQNGEEAVAPDKEIVRDIREVRTQDLESIDAIIHLAALSNDPLGQLDPELTFDINSAASIRLATMAKEAGVSRFIFASSCSIYGAAKNEMALDETAPVNPVSAYAVSKVRTEAVLSELAGHRFSPVFMRNATAYGVSPRLRFDLVLNNLMAWAKTTGQIKVMSDGTPWRPLVHIQDISRAAIAAVEAPLSAVHNQAFNIGRNDANYRVSEIAAEVGKAVPSAKIEIRGESGGDPRSYRVDFTKAATRLPGFAPTWTIDHGCTELDLWFSRRASLNTDFESRSFIRLKQLLYLIESGKVDKKLYLYH
jgi:nucleoside-diphosphate-sugar epimerase